MVYLLLIFAVLMRLVPHVPNFAPIAAMALFGGVYLEKKWAIILPITAMFLSDLFIGTYTWQIMVSVYGSFAVSGLIGIWLKKRKNIATVIGGTLSSSVLFFVVTNFAVWAFSKMYPLTIDGLIACYAAAIPFFRNTLMGDFFFVGLLFGSYEFAMALKSRRAGLQKV